jgi:signal transduction histidine kinase
LHGFKDISIKRKLTGIVIVTSTAALLLAGAASFIYELVTFPKNLSQHLASLAGVVGNNSAATIVFSDDKTAAETLSALQATPDIVMAQVYRKDGTVLATYVRKGAQTATLAVPKGFFGENFAPGYVEVFRPISLGAEQVGGIGLRSDLREREERLWAYGQAGLVVFCLSLLVALGVAAILQRVVSLPILNLARIARGISEEHDYSKRAVKDTEDEIGSLVDSFNNMLTQIEARDSALIHAQGELEQRVRDLQTEVAERQRAEKGLAEKTAELQRSNAELEQFAYVASHDLQEPLRMITGYTQLLAKRYHDKLDETAAEFIGYAVDGAKRMQGLIRDLLTYSRVGTRGKPFAWAQCDKILGDTIVSLKVAIEESGATITHDPLPTVLCDEGQLGQLFQNLLGNGIKYRNSTAPRIYVSCRREGPNWLFSVKDNGIGVDPRYAERIFIIFQRLHTRDQYPGTGIGLAVCKKIVERHSGKIWLESQLGQGATFYFTIPATQNAEGASL